MEEIHGCLSLKSDEELRVRIHNLFDIEDYNGKVPENISSFFILLPIMEAEFNNQVCLRLLCVKMTILF